MGKINLLGFEVANLIAAGEVVERPASVVKELLENAIDAGATQITAEIKNGGVSLIRISDNGCGMTAEDLPLAIRRHATSKIQNAQDLDAIATLGFRGEALAAIASVSELTILTKTKEAEMGTMLVASSGVVTDLSEVGCADGTTVVVEQLFAMVPARRKFLKKDRTEASAVGALIEKIALSRPDISFRFISDGDTKFVTTGDGDVKNTLHALYGREFAGKLLSVKGEQGGVSVEGYVGTSENVKGNRAYQNAYINGRYVKSKTIMAALEEAFTSYISPDRYPVSCLYLTIDCGRVDVNVHPAKTEVRFSDERPVFEVVYWAVRSALEQNQARPEMALTDRRLKGERLAGAHVPMVGRPVPLTQMEMDTKPSKAGEEKGNGHSADAPYPFPTYTPPTPHSGASSFGVIGVGDIGGGFPTSPPSSTAKETPYAPPKSEPKYHDTVNTPPVEPPKTEVQADIDTPAPTEQRAEPWRVLGVVMDCYIIAQTKEGMLIIDQHAAHERVLFEDMLKEQKAHGKVASQSLLVPLSFSLSAEGLEMARDEKDAFISIGYDYTFTGGRMISLTAIPMALDAASAESFFQKTIQEMAEGRATPTISDQKRQERTLYQMACKAAIKGGRNYDHAHVVWLCEKLQALPDILVCPHGRPIAYLLTKKELDHRFGRI